MAYRQDWITLIRALATKYGVDPRAALAVASTEGLGGGVGDAGTSFGPFQLHVGGALPQGKTQAWAESPAGITYALEQIGKVAGGLTGPAAIKAIVQKFERPADPAGQIQKALAAYGSFPGGAKVGGAVAPAAAPALSPGGGGAPAPDMFRRQLAMALMQGGGNLGQDDLLSLALAKRQQQTAGAPPTPGMPTPTPQKITSPVAPTPGAPIPGATIPGALREAFYDPLGQYDNGVVSPKGIGNHSDHVHLSIIKAQAMLAAIRKARELGLDPRENPYTDPVDPVHVKGSFHYNTFPGMYGGKKLGQGLDVSGDPQKMAAYYKWALANLR